MLVRWRDGAVPVSIVVGAVALVLTLVAWRADNQLPDTTTFPAYLGGIAGALGLLVATIGGFRSKRHVSWAVVLNFAAMLVALGALARYTALPYGH